MLGQASQKRGRRLWATFTCVLLNPEGYRQSVIGGGVYNRFCHMKSRSQGEIQQHHRQRAVKVCSQNREEKIETIGYTEASYRERPDTLQTVQASPVCLYRQEFVAELTDKSLLPDYILSTKKTWRALGSWPHDLYACVI